MGQSKYNKPASTLKSVANGVSNGGGVLRLELNRDELTVEQRINITLTHAASAAVTAAGDCLALVEKVELETDRGTEVVTQGIDIAALNALVENPSSQRESLGTSNTVEFGFDIHHEMDGSLYDLMTAMETGERSKHTLVLTLATSAAAVLTGGTLSGTPTYTVDIEAKRYPSLTGLGAIEVEGNQYAGVGSVVHRTVTNNEAGTVKGALAPIQMTSAGAVTRFVQFLCFDASGANPVLSDAVLGAIRLVAGGKDVIGTNFKNLQRSNERSRGLTLLGSGQAVIDFGDDPDEWLDMSEIKDARLYLTVDAGAPSSYEIRITEDYVASA